MIEFTTLTKHIQLYSAFNINKLTMKKLTHNDVYLSSSLLKFSDKACNVNIWQIFDSYSQVNKILYLFTLLFLNSYLKFWKQMFIYCLRVRDLHQIKILISKLFNLFFWIKIIIWYKLIFKITCMYYLVEKYFQLTLCRFWKVLFLFLMKQDNNANAKLVIHMSVYLSKSKHFYA